MVRFAPGEFRYNGRVAAALIPSLIVLAGFGGKVPVGVSLVGAMVSYILDALRYREGALGGVWLTLGSVNLSLWLSGAIFVPRRPIFLSLLTAVCSGITLFTTGVWATLQFKWIQLQYPVVVLAFEKLLLATAFTVAAMVQSWGLIAAVGASHAPFYLAPILCGLYYQLALPLTTSFHVRGPKDSAIGGKRSKELQVQAPMEGFCAALILSLLPAALYAVIHGSVLRQWTHFWSLLLLSSAPVLFLSVLEEGLWWLPGGPKQRNAVRRLLCLGSLAAMLGGFEGRIVFPAFGQYIQLHPPWNYAAVTIALYGAAALAIIQLSGLLGETQNTLLVSTALMLSAGLGAAAAGVPLSVMAAPLIAAGGLALYLESWLLKDYALFVLGAALTAAWFIIHHFWFLDINLQGLHVRQLCILLWVAIIPALVLPGLIISKGPAPLVSLLLLLQAVLIAILEEHLYLGADGVEGEMYPAVMVVLTSAMGLALAHRLRSPGTTGLLTTWLLHCLFSSKLSMLLLPQAQLPLPIFFLALAVSAPMLLHQLPAEAPRLTRTPPPWQGVAHSLAVLVATLRARYAVFKMLHLTLGSRPSEGTLLGVMVLIAAGGCAPLVAVRYKDWRGGKRLLVLAATAGLLLIVLRPPLPLQGGATCPDWLPSGLCFRLWDQEHLPEHELDDIAIWGEYGERRERWPLWMLAGAALAALAAATQQLPGSQSATGGLLYAGLSGLSIGGYLALEFFPNQLAIQLIIMCATLAVAGVLVGLRLRGSASPALLSLMLFLWAGGLPLAAFVQAVVPLPVLPEDARRLFAGSAVLINEQREQANRAALLAVYTAEALLLAFALKLRVSAALSSLGPSLPEARSRAAAAFKLGNAYADQAASFLGQCLPLPAARIAITRSSSIKGPMGGALAQLSSEGLSWLPTVANVVTLTCFGLSLLLNSYLTQGADLAIFALAPILLLLSQDPLLWALNPRRRYFPVTLAVSSYLAASSVLQAFAAWNSPESLTNKTASSLFSLFKTLVLVLAALPSHFYFNQYIWSRVRISGTRLLVIAPLNIAAALFSDFHVVVLLAGCGLLMSCVHCLAMQHVRAEGMKLI